MMSCPRLLLQPVLMPEHREIALLCRTLSGYLKVVSSLTHIFRYILSLTAFVILICNRFTSFSTSFQSILFHWFFSCLFASFSSSDVIEFLAFIGLPSFTQSNTSDKSAHFHVEANFEPLFSRLQADFRFLLYPMPSVPSLLLAKFLPK